MQKYPVVLGASSHAELHAEIHTVSYPVVYEVQGRHSKRSLESYKEEFYNL